MWYFPGWRLVRYLIGGSYLAGGTSGRERTLATLRVFWPAHHCPQLHDRLVVVSRTRLIKALVGELLDLPLCPAASGIVGDSEVAAQHTDHITINRNVSPQPRYNRQKKQYTRRNKSQ